jgi:hypothetical protein
MKLISCKLADWGRNTFKLQTQGADSGRNGSIITLNLPENSLLHLQTLRLFMRFTGITSGVLGSGNEVFTKLGQDRCLVSRLELFCNGIQLNNPMNEYNSAFRLLNMCRSTLDKDTSMDRCLSKAWINPLDQSDVFDLCYSNWLGFIGESSCQWVSSDLIGSLQLRITLSQTDVLVPKQVAVPITTQIVVPAAVANAQQLSYTVSNIFFTINSGVPPAAYTMLLRDLLEGDGKIEINYRNYYSFSLDNITSGSATNRFSISTASCDKIYSSMRDASYLTTGAPAFGLVDAIGQQFVSNSCRFRAFSGPGSAVKLFKTINNVQYGQYLMDPLEALANSTYVVDKLPGGTEGNLITSQEAFADGQFVDATILNCNSELGVGLKSGYNSLGVNSFMTATQQGMAIPPVVAGALSADTGKLSQYTLVETTATMECRLGKSIFISY